jgi:hypothetical protein
MSTPFPPIARVRMLWLNDHPASTAEDYERVSAPSPRRAATRREHSAYLDWLSTARVRRLLGFPPVSEGLRFEMEKRRAENERRGIKQPM